MTTDSLGISGIGYPSMGLGTLGLGAGSMYGSYDNYMPSMMGMNPMFGMGSGYGINPMMSMGGMGISPSFGMGMYNPLYYTQMQGAAEQIQAQHAGNMHSTLVNNEVRANRETDSALIQKMLTNSDIIQGIENLHVAVKEGKQDDICKKFDELQKYIYSTYSDELKARGAKNNAATSATRIIGNLYSRIISAQTGETATLRGDIERYGESSVMNGFMNTFRPGHGTRYVDQTLSHCFGDQIEDKASKDRRKVVASGVGRVASVLEKGVYGIAGGAAAYTLGYGITKGIASLWGGGKNIKFSGRWLGKAAVIGALVGAAADIWWQVSGSKESAA